MDVPSNVEQHRLHRSVLRSWKRLLSCQHITTPPPQNVCAAYVHALFNIYFVQEILAYLYVCLYLRLTLPNDVLPKKITSNLPGQSSTPIKTE
jgi:hypothetical protein